VLELEGLDKLQEVQHDFLLSANVGHR
jgi:hypothetical protein